MHSSCIQFLLLLLLLLPHLLLLLLLLNILLLPLLLFLLLLLLCASAFTPTPVPDILIFSTAYHCSCFYSCSGSYTCSCSCSYYHSLCLSCSWFIICPDHFPAPAPTPTTAPAPIIPPAAYPAPTVVPVLLLLLLHFVRLFSKHKKQKQWENNELLDNVGYENNQNNFISLSTLGPFIMVWFDFSFSLLHILLKLAV